MEEFPPVVGSIPQILSDAQFSCAYFRNYTYPVFLFQSLCSSQTCHVGDKRLQECLSHRKIIISLDWIISLNLAENSLLHYPIFLQKASLVFIILEVQDKRGQSINRHSCIRKDCNFLLFYASLAKGIHCLLPLVISPSKHLYLTGIIPSKRATVK